MKILVFGNKGMLGRYVYSYLETMGYDVIGHSRVNGDIVNYDEQQLLGLMKETYKLEENDVVVNCIGVIKPMIDHVGVVNTIRTNSIFPHFLANSASMLGVKVISVTTDCVYSGKDGGYSEKSLHDCTDVYGKSKSLGEPENCTVIRTSIIGEEVGNNRSFIEWVKSTDGKTVNGFTNHQWNGLTCLQVAKVIKNMVDFSVFWDGVRHIYSPNTLSKYEMVKTIAGIYNIDVKINPIDANEKCDRSLSTLHYMSLFDIPTIENQIQDQKNFYDILKKY